MVKKLGFIGCGNMGSAMAGGIIKSGILDKTQIIASAKSQSSMDRISNELQIEITADNKKIAAESEVVILAVKPIFYEAVIKEISEYITDKTIVISIAPGHTLEKLGNFFGKDVKIIRSMPNTPALVGEGITGVCRNSLVTDDELDYILRLFGGFGKAEVIEERLMDAVIVASGSSPAYVFMFIEAMADGAVREGMPRDKAYRFAAQAVLGSAKMVLETGMHPGELKDMVCSPGGTTIEAVRVLEEKGFRSAVMEAMAACAKKAKG